MANLTQKEIEARIKAFEREMKRIPRTPVSEAEFVLNEMSIAQKGKHLEVLNAHENSVGTQDVSIKAFDNKDRTEKDDGQEK